MSDQGMPPLADFPLDDTNYLETPAPKSIAEEYDALQAQSIQPNFPPLDESRRNMALEYSRSVKHDTVESFIEGATKIEAYLKGDSNDLDEP